jgi:hypothetical protein
MQIAIHTPTSNLSDSIDFYARLGFQNISEGQKTLFTEGTTLIEVNPDRHARAGIKLYKPEWEAEVTQLSKLTHIEPHKEGYLLSDPSGVWIYLVSADFAMPYDLEGPSNSVLGNYAGLTFETTDLIRSSNLYESLGFKKESGDPENGFVAYSLNGFSITLIGPGKCPHLFFNPSMTFFNGKQNPAIIQKVRDLEISITEEITHFNPDGEVDNIIIRDPGGYGFFIFND